MARLGARWCATTINSEGRVGSRAATPAHNHRSHPRVGLDPHIPRAVSAGKSPGAQFCGCHPRASRRTSRPPAREVGMTQTDNVAETNHPGQPGNAWVRSTFYGLATRTVVVRCPLCHHGHPHHWQYESGDEDPGERPAPCGRGQYVVRLRRAVQERLPNKPPPHPAPARSSATGTTTSGAERTARDRTTSPATPDPADLVRGRPERPPASPRRLHSGPGRGECGTHRPCRHGRAAGTPPHCRWGRHDRA